MPEFSSQIQWAFLFAFGAIFVLGGAFIFSLLVGQRRVISAQKDKMEAIREKEQKYSDLFNNVTDVVFIQGLDGSIQEINAAVGYSIGFTPSELLGKKFQSLIVPDFHENYEAFFQNVLENKTAQTLLQLSSKDGQALFFELRSSVISGEDKPIGLRGIAREVTKQVEAENSLKESERRFRLLTDFSPIPIAVQVAGRWVYANAAAVKLLAADSDKEIIGKSILKFILPDRRAIFCGQLKEQLANLNKVQSIESKILCFDGSQKEVEIIAMPTVFDGRQGGQVVIRDVTAQRKLQRDLARAQRLETAGKVAGQIAHDFNNLLAPLTAYPTLIRDDMTEDDASRPLLDEIEAAADQIAQTNQQLLALGRRGHYAVEIVELNELLEKLLRHNFNSNGVVLEKDFTENLQRIKGGRAQLTRAINNLLVNAKEAMDGIGRLSLKTENVVLSEPNNLSLPPGLYVKLDVADSGSGIEESILERIFDPFFSTKSMDRVRGSGLGLSIVHGIVDDHEGKIKVQSEVGKGTTFSLYFPGTDELVPTTTTTPQEMPVGDGQRILLVDDDSVQRRVMKRILKHLNYNVVDARSGEKAVDLSQKYEYDLLILDMVMQGIDGTDTYKLISENKPGQKAIVMSGFAPSDRVKKVLELGASEFLHKPISMPVLAKTIKKVLGT